LAVDHRVKNVRPADWRGVTARENIIKGEILPLLSFDKAEVERVFRIIFAQREY